LPHSIICINPLWVIPTHSSTLIEAYGSLLWGTLCILVYRLHVSLSWVSTRIAGLY